ncbi:MAG: aminotransferase class I/II-fold pyridoxal phosphate-dependent enzyme [Saccharofermentanales bacterium]
MADIPFDRTPIIKMLSECLGNEKVSYHMPGHNRGADFPEWLHRHALRIDTTEFSLTDDLNHPHRQISAALDLARQAFDSGRTYFVTTGATIAIHAAIYALTRPGDLIIAGRNAHRSLVGACRMYGLSVVFTSDAGLIDALDRYPQAVLVYMTRPDYFGTASDMAETAHAVHSCGKYLVVDEAHGTHFAFASDLMPQSALSAGGDVVIHSAHKTAPALTQGAYLHISHEALQTGRISDLSISEALSIATTSSPSFLIAASLDYARAYLEINGRYASMALHESIRQFYQSLHPEWLDCMPNSAEAGIAGNGSGAGGFHSVNSDPFRIVICPYEIGITPLEVSEELARAGIYPEFIDLTRVVLICKFSNTHDDFRHLSNALNGLYDRISACGSTYMASRAASAGTVLDLQHRLDRRMASSAMKVIHFSRSRPDFNGSETIPLASSAGRIVSDDCIPYPPGVPLVFAGEVLDRESIDILLACIRSGLTIIGIGTEPAGSDHEAIPSVRVFR